MRFEDFQDGPLCMCVCVCVWGGGGGRGERGAILSSLGSIHITVWEEMPFEKFQDGHHGGHLGCQNATNLTVLNFHASPMPPTKFQLNPTYHLGADVLSRFWWPSCILEPKDLAIINLHVTPMPPTKFGLNPTYHSGADLV